MKFEDMPLVIPNAKKINKKILSFIEELKNAQSAKETLSIIRRFNKYAEDFSTAFNIIYVKYSLDTRNEEYVKAQQIADEVGPALSEYSNEFIRLLVKSPYRAELEETLGSYLFTMYENSLKTFDPVIVPELIEENKLVSEYGALIASAQIPYKGEVLNLSQLGKYMQDIDRNIRRESCELYYKFLSDNEEKLGMIFDKLVHVRTSMAKKLGFKSYTELGYLRLGRVDYDKDKVKNYRDQIYASVVPVSKKLAKRQKERLNIDKPYFYDYSLAFLSGNPTPVGNREELVKKATKMYDEMSPETSEFFHFMLDNHLLDLDARAGKQGGGYMTYFPKYKSPFIFANFNGTAGDVATLTHEVGHAFQGYESRNIKTPEYQSPTLEACEIHSMSMEFFAIPWMKSFFEKDTEKYEFYHLEDSIMFLPYGVAVDEFQHFVYENPDATHNERCAKWSEIDKKYRPYLNYKGFPFLEHGGYWLRQSHIFQTPFYYIDYTLAQVVAFQFAVEMEKNHEKAWKKYVKLCKMGGKYPFATLLEKNHLRVPFNDGSVAKVIRPLAKKLGTYDDKKM